MKNPFRKTVMVDVPVPHPYPAYFPISPEIHKADLAALRGRDEHDEVLGPVLRLLVEARATMFTIAESPHTKNVERAVYGAAGITTAIQKIISATRSGSADYQQTGFGKEE